MRSLFLIVARFLVVPVLLVLGAVTGGADGFVGWFFLAWMLWRGGPAMWQDVKNACRWFFGMKARYSVTSIIRGRRSVAGGGLNV